MPKTDSQRAHDYVLECLKKGTANLANVISFRPQEYRDIDENAIADAWLNLFLDGWIGPNVGTGQGTWLHGEWLRITPYGQTQLGLVGPDYYPVFLDPTSTIAGLTTEIPNIDSIALRYFEETLWAIKKRLFLSAIVTMGCASERSMLLLVDAVLDYYNDPTLQNSFDKAAKIKPKFELLKKTIKDRGLRKDLLSMLAGDKAKYEDLKHLFVDFDNTLDQMFQIYRTNRNDAGHPSGIAFDMDITRAEAAMFRKYCKIIYGTISYIEMATALKKPP